MNLIYIGQVLKPAIVLYLFFYQHLLHFISQNTL